MDKKREITYDLYLDGYKSSDINCIDIPIAACAGGYCRENYFYYCLMYCYYMNWKSSIYSNWYNVRKEILDIIGINFKCLTTTKDIELLRITKDIINNNNPVFWVVKYGALFYSKYYGMGTYDHGIIISDYNKINNTFGIRDREPVREYIDSGIFKSDILHRIQIQSTHLMDIWRKSNTIFSEENSIHKNTIYYMQRVDNDISKDNKQAIKNLINNKVLREQNQLRVWFDMLNKKVRNKIEVSSGELENIQRVFVRSWRIFYEVLEQYLLNGLRENSVENAIKIAFELFIEKRKEFLNIFLTKIIRKEIISEEEIIDIISKDTYNFNNFIEKM